MTLRDKLDILARARGVLDTEAHAIRDAASRLSDDFAAGVEAILACRGRVCVTGVGKAGLIGDKIQATFASTGTLSYRLHAADALHGDLGMVHPDDVVVALSKSGATEFVVLLPRLHALGCRIVLLTANPDSEAARCADWIIHIGATPEACPLGLAPSSSTTSMLALGDALALTVMEARAVRPEQYAEYHPGGALGRVLMKADEIMRTGDDCPRVRAEAVLGECYEAILKAPLRAGACCVVDDAGVLHGIVTQGDFLRCFRDAQRLAERPVAELMTVTPKRVRADSPVTEALAMMREFSIDEIPVIDDAGRLVGLIDVQDLIAHGFSALDGE